jgi:hypothetical protein
MTSTIYRNVYTMIEIYTRCAWNRDENVWCVRYKLEVMPQTIWWTADHMSNMNLKVMSLARCSVSPSSLMTTRYILLIYISPRLWLSAPVEWAGDSKEIRYSLVCSKWSRKASAKCKCCLVVCMQELLPLHPQQLPGEEAGGASVDGLPHGDHHVRGPPHAPPL